MRYDNGGTVVVTKVDQFSPYYRRTNYVQILYALYTRYIESKSFNLFPPL